MDEKRERDTTRICNSLKKEGFTIHSTPAVNTREVQIVFVNGKCNKNAGKHETIDYKVLSVPQAVATVCAQDAVYTFQNDDIRNGLRRTPHRFADGKRFWRGRTTLV